MDVTTKMEFMPLCVPNMPALLSVLSNYPSLKTGEWLKSPESLMTELAIGDCVLGIQNGRLHRRVDVCRVKCFHKRRCDGALLQLFEDKQIFVSGKERRRNFDYVAEKIMLGEKPETAALRALREELSISDPAMEVKLLETECSCETKISDSYTGLECTYNCYTFSCQISEKNFCEEYVEKQEDKSTYFSWRRI